MKIGKKLFLGFSGIVLLTVLIDLHSILQLNKIARPLHTEIPLSVKGLYDAAHVSRVAESVRYYDEVLTQSARNYSFTQDPNWKERYTTAEPQMEALLEEALQRGDPSEREAFAAIARSNNALVEMEHQALEAAGRGQREKSTQILESVEYKRQKEIFSRFLGKFVERKNLNYDEAVLSSSRAIMSSLAQVQSQIRLGKRKVVAVLVIVVLLSLGLSVLISRSVSRPIRALQTGMKIVGSGDLDHRVGTAAQDEIGQLSRSFDEMAVNFKKVTASRDELNREIVVHKRLEETLRENEEKFQAVITAAHNAVIMIDDDDRILIWNDAAERIFGHSRQEALGKRAHILLAPSSYREKSLLEFPRWRETGQGAAVGKTVELSALRKDGTEFPVELSLSSLHMKGHWTAIAIIRDITERKKAGDVLRQSEEKFRTLFEESKDVIYFSGSGGKWIDVNQAGVELFGFPSKEKLLESSFLDLYVNPESRKQFLETTSQQIFVKDYPMVLKRRDGRQVDVLISGRAVKNEQGENIGFRGMMHDITERKKAEEEIRWARDEAESANRMKSAFLANMSHEIRTPMNGVLGMATLLLDTELTPIQREYSETVHSSAEALLTVINDILDFSKVEAGRLELDKTDFDLHRCIEDTVELLALQAQQKGLEFVCMIDDDVPDYVEGDPGRLRQILTNLIGNAVKFTEHGEVTVRIRMKSLTEEAVVLYGEVRDTGIGIAREDQSRLFTPFTQVDASTTRRFGGTGLGLSISRKLVEMMGGEIGMESEIDRGTRFWFTVFLSPAKSRSLQSTSPGTISGRRMLVVDDNETNRKLLEMLLTGWGCRCETAADSRAALEKLRSARQSGDPFDVALLDMEMPIMNGEDLGRAIKQDKALSPTRLVMLTSLGERGEAHRLLQIGFSGYLPKPVRREQLYQCLKTVMGRPAGGAASAQPLVTRHLLAEQRNGSRRVLIVEDNLVNQKVARGLVEKLGLLAEVASNGREALDMMVRSRYDLVLMDCQMPVMDGYEAATLLRKPDTGTLDPNVPVIAMTAHTMKGDREHCLQSGMDDYVSKPVKPSELAAAIERWLDRKHSAVRKEAAVPSRSRDDDGGDFDLNEFLDRMMGDETLADTVIAAFLEDTPKQMSAFKHALAADDAAAAQRIAHSIKGAAGNMACPRLHRAAESVERACREGRLDEARPLGDELSAAFARAESAIRQAGIIASEERS